MSIHRDKEYLNKTNVIKRLDKYKSVNANGCWIFTGAERNKYGALKFEGKMYKVNRLAAFAYLGFDLNSNLLVLHKLICVSKFCFNPEHLYVGTHSDNSNDSVISRTHRNIVKTHCPQGHEYTEDNTYYSLKARLCKTCHHERYLAKKRKEVQESAKGI